jgi:hypothetical protein
MRAARTAAGRPTIRLDDRAQDDLRFIRETMERTAQFTAVPGRGGMLMGVVGLLAAPLAATRATPGAWLAVWLGAAFVAAAIALAAMVRKARTHRVPLAGPAARKFALGFTPAIAAGGLLTVALATRGLVGLLPGTWLLLYGAGVVAAGAFSPRAVPLLGLVLMALGCAALLWPEAPGDAFMAAGFGAAHIAAGWRIARRHGG